MAERSGSGQDNPMEREAKDDIEAVRDIVSEKPAAPNPADPGEMARLDAQLAEAVARREALSRSPREHASEIEEVTARIYAIQARMAAIDPQVRRDPDLYNPDAMLEDGSVLAQLAEDATPVRAEGSREETAARRAAEQARADAAAREAELAQYGPAERALRESNVEIDAAAIDNARAKDDMTKTALEKANRQGCTSPKLLAAIGVGAAIIVAVIAVVLSNGGTSDKSTTEAANNPPPGAGGGDATSIIGHWELVSGLNEPTGRDTGIVCGSCGGVNSINIGPSTATLDISENAVTGGTYVTSYEEVADPCVGHKYTFTATNVSGGVDPVKGFATIRAEGAYTQDGPCDENSSSSHSVVPTTISFQVFFKDGGLTGCYALNATLDGCAEPAGGSMAEFR